MLDIEFVKLFLARYKIPLPSYILLKAPQENNFTLIESFDGIQPDHISEIPNFEHDQVTADAKNKRSLLWLKYPENAYVVAAFPDDVSLDIFTMNVLYHLLIPAFITEPSNKLETRFESIVSNIVDQSSTADFNNLINKILEETISIVRADAGMLWVFDSGINKLVCKAYKGSVTDLALSLRLELGEGLIGKTFLRGTPKLYSSYPEVLPDIDDFSPENKIKVLSLFGDKMMDSAFLMPIFVNKVMECILIVYRVQGNPPFSSADLETMKIFAEMIEMTMTNARSLITLQTQLDTLTKCNAFYSKLTSLSVNNSGISNIVKELKGVLNVPVLVINLMTHEQYPRNAAFEMELLNMLTQRNVTNGDTFIIESKNRSDRYSVYPILIENSCLGYLIARSKDNESQIDKMMLEIGRMVIALELSKAQSMLDISFKRSAQNFFELINLNDPLELTKKCSELGIDSNANYAVVVFTIPNENNELQSASVYRLIANIKRELIGTQKIVFSSQEKIIVLISMQSTNGIIPISEKIGEMITRAQKNENITICGGMGSLYPGPNSINRSYREAQNALMYQLSQHNAGFMQYSEMGVNQLFINLTSEEATTFLSKIFTPLREKSRQSDSLEATLIAYIESNCSMTQTAKQLYIHTNTLYQRLRKIETCLNLSFRKPDDLLQIQLACYLRNNYPDIYNFL
jgi:sugar diacid utilization regulator